MNFFCFLKIKNFIENELVIFTFHLDLYLLLQFLSNRLYIYHNLILHTNLIIHYIHFPNYHHQNLFLVLIKLYNYTFSILICIFHHSFFIHFFIPFSFSFFYFLLFIYFSYSSIIMKFFSFIICIIC